MSMDVFSSQIASVSAYSDETALGGNIGGLDNQQKLDKNIAIYTIVKKNVEEVWKNYASQQGQVNLTQVEIKKFLTAFLKSHGIDESGVDIVFKQMDINGDGQINKYELAVFLLKVAQYEELVKEEDIEQHTGFYSSSL